MARPAVAAVAAVLVLAAWGALAAVVRRDRRPTGSRPGPGRLPPVRLTPLGRGVLLGAAALLPVVGVAILNSSSGFVWDDLKNLRQAQVADLSIDYLMEPTSGHFAPGHRLGDWIQQRAFGFDFPAAQAQLLVGFALSLVLFQRILAELFGAGLGSYLFTLAFGFSMVHVGVTQWWASGLDRVPATVLSFLSIWAYLRWYRSRAWPWLGVSLVAVGLGLLFYIKPIFVPVYLVLMTVLLIQPERPLGQSLVAVLRDWWVWLLYAAVTGVLGWVYVSRYPLELREGGGVDVAFAYLRILWSRVFVPNLFGIFIPRGVELSAGMVAAAVVAQILLAAVVVATIVRWRGAWRAWAFFAVTFLLNALVVGLTRVFSFTTEIIAYTVYFNLESVIVFFLALAAAVLGRPASDEREVSPSPAAARTAVAAGLAAYVGLSMWGGWRISVPENWIGARSRVILDRAERQLSDLHRAGVDVALVDGVLPDDVIPYLLVPYNSTSEVVPLFDERATFDTDQGELFAIEADGQVRPVRFAGAAGGPANQLVTTDRFGVVGATPQYLDGERVCVEARDENVTIGLRTPHRLEWTEGPIALRVEVESPGPALLSTVVEPLPVNTESLAGGRAKYRLVNIPGRERVHRVFALDAFLVDVAYLVLPAGTDLCLYRMEVGHLVGR
ncbi:MAG: hypothetical protein ACLGI2_02580 [Acidimicrobiia bacterium]